MIMRRQSKNNYRRIALSHRYDGVLIFQVVEKIRFSPLGETRVSCIDNSWIYRRVI